MPEVTAVGILQAKEVKEAVMIVKIDREKRIILLKWLKQGFINTLDLPEAYKDGTLFFELLKESSIKEDEEVLQEKAK